LTLGIGPLMELPALSVIVNILKSGILKDKTKRTCEF
jgi:hypothetical protein